MRYVSSPAIPSAWRLDASTLTFGQPRKIVEMTLRGRLDEVLAVVEDEQQLLCL